MKSSGYFYILKPKHYEPVSHPSVFIYEVLSAHGAVRVRPWGGGRAPMGRWALKKSEIKTETTTLQTFLPAGKM